MKNISLGGKSYEVEEDVLEKIEDLLDDEDAVEVESMSDFVGQKLAFQCARYIYFGKVEKVNETFIELSDAQMVFDTGEFSSKTPSNAQDLPKERTFLMRQSIENIYPTKWS